MILNTYNLINSAQVAKACNVSAKTIYKWRVNGKINGFKLGQNYFYKKSDVETLLGCQITSSEPG